MHEMVLLGAGASADAGVPPSVPMAKEILARLRDDSFSFAGVEGRVASFVAGGLMFQRGIRGDDPFGGIDVEELFAAVQLLARRHSLEAAPFIGSWHAMVDEFDRVQRSSGFVMKQLLEGLHQGVVGELAAKLPRQLNNRSALSRGMARDPAAAIESAVIGTLQRWLDAAKRGRPRTPAFFDRKFADAVAATERRPGEGEVFERTGARMIQLLRELVWIEQASKVDYLRPLLGPATQPGGLTIATLNYDNAVELLAEQAQVDLTTGLAGWTTTSQFDRDRADQLLLLKLHGSIDWVAAEQSEPQGRPMPAEVARVATPEEMANSWYTPLVVFGQGNKLTAKGPFLDLLQALRRELAMADRLTVVGYSFRDDHVNEYVTHWLNEDAARRLRIIDHSFETSRASFVELLRYRVSDRLEVISAKAKAGLAQIA